MHIVPETTHVLLSYIRAVTRRGASLPVGALEAFGVTYGKRKVRREYTGIAAGVLNAMQTLASTEHTTPTETVVAYLQRCHWITVSQERGVRLTPLGEALLRELDAPKPQEETEATEVLLDPSDPFAYIRVLGVLADVGPAMLVDPYFRFDQLPDITDNTDVNKVLTSKKVGSKGLKALSLALAVIPEQKRPEVRAARTLHDRFIIPNSGYVVAIGTSLNSVGAAVSTIMRMSSVASDALRRAHVDIWAAAEIVQPRERADALGLSDSVEIALATDLQT